MHTPPASDDDDFGPLRDGVRAREPAAADPAARAVTRRIHQGEAAR